MIKPAARTLTPASFKKRCLHAYAVLWGCQNIDACLIMLGQRRPCPSGVRAIQQAFGGATKLLTFAQFTRLIHEAWESYGGSWQYHAHQVFADECVQAGWRIREGSL